MALGCGWLLNGDVKFLAAAARRDANVFIYNNASTSTANKQPDKVFTTTHTSLDQALYIP